MAGPPGADRSSPSVLRAGALEREQLPLPVQAAGEAAEPAVRGDDPVARDQDARPVLPERLADRPRGVGPPDRRRDLPVRTRLPIRDPTRRLEHGPLERRVCGPVHVVALEVHVAAGQVAPEVRRQRTVSVVRPASVPQGDLLDRPSLRRHDDRPAPRPDPLAPRHAPWETGGLHEGRYKGTVHVTLAGTYTQYPCPDVRMTVFGSAAK